MQNLNLLRQLTVMGEDGKKKKISVDPADIVFIEELSETSCNVVIKVVDRSFIYQSPNSHQSLSNFVNMNQLGLFIEN